MPGDERLCLRIGVLAEKMGREEQDVFAHQLLGYIQQLPVRRQLPDKLLRQMPARQSNLTVLPPFPLLQLIKATAKMENLLFREDLEFAQEAFAFVGIFEVFRKLHGDYVFPTILGAINNCA